MKPVTIRKASPEDLDTLLRFEQGIIQTERPFDNTLKEGLIHYYDIEKMITDPDVEVVVAESGAEIVGSGYACIKEAKLYLKHSQYAYLGFMYVREDYRGKGINQKIIDALKKWCISRNITEIRLKVYADNLPAIKAYEKAGFTKHMIEMRMPL